MASQPPSNPYQFESQTPYATASQAQPLVKPKAIKVFGILNVIFGGLGLLGTCIGLGAILAITSGLLPAPEGQSNPAFVTQDEDAFLYFTTLHLRHSHFSLLSSYLSVALVYYNTRSGVEMRVWLGWHTASSQQSLPRS